MTTLEIITDVDNKLKEAMKTKDSIVLETMRSIKTNVTNWQKANPNKDLNILPILNSMAKQRRQSIEEYLKGGIQHLAYKEKAELNIIEQYLPKNLTEEEVLIELPKIISKIGATSIKDLGKVIKEFNLEYSGRFDGKRLSELIKNILI
jgi:uncharacterized protein YqeY